LTTTNKTFNTLPHNVMPSPIHNTEYKIRPTFQTVAGKFCLGVETISLHVPDLFSA